MNDLTEKVLLVFNGFLSLSHDERQQLVNMLNNYYKLQGAGKSELETACKRVALGPLSSNPCPCCGK